MTKSQRPPHSLGALVPCLGVLTQLGRQGRIRKSLKVTLKVDAIAEAARAVWVPETVDAPPAGSWLWSCQGGCGPWTSRIGFLNVERSYFVNT